MLSGSLVCFSKGVAKCILKQKRIPLLFRVIASKVQPSLIAAGKTSAARGTSNFGIRDPVRDIDQIVGFGIREAGCRMEKIDMLKFI